MPQGVGWVHAQLTQHLCVLCPAPGALWPRSSLRPCLLPGLDGAISFSPHAWHEAHSTGSCSWGPALGGTGELCFHSSKSPGVPWANHPAVARISQSTWVPGHPATPSPCSTTELWVPGQVLGSVRVHRQLCAGAGIQLGEGGAGQGQDLCQSHQTITVLLCDRGSCMVGVAGPGSSREGPWCPLPGRSSTGPSHTGAHTLPSAGGRQARCLQGCGEVNSSSRDSLTSGHHWRCRAKTRNP